MTAIDLAAYLIGRLLKSPSSLMESGVLCTIAAGADTPADIAHTLGTTASCTTTTCHRLAKKGLICSTIGADDLTTTYHLTPTGKDTVKALLNFLKH